MIGLLARSEVNVVVCKVPGPIIGGPEHHRDGTGRGRSYNGRTNHLDSVCPIAVVDQLLHRWARASFRGAKTSRTWSDFQKASGTSRNKSDVKWISP